MAAALDLNHLHLHVRDIPEAEAFYQRYFGMRFKVHRGPVSFLTSDEGFDLALAPDPDPAPLPSWFHFGFRLKSAQAVKWALARMIDDDVIIDHPLEESEDYVGFRCRDRDGYGVEVYYEPQVDTLKGAR